ncbi:hypothetical protein [Allokutzneria albata]|nr:hypothetical protein [Allokutzneria albata]
MKRDEFWKVVGLALIAAVALGALLAVVITVISELILLAGNLAPRG